MAHPSICSICGAANDPDLGCPSCLWGEVMGNEYARPDGGDQPEIPGYTITGELGRGGMGVVYRANQESPAREVALKIVAPGSLRATEERRRFRVEVEAMAAMAHPGILPLYESGEDDHGRPWFTMLLADGGTLAARVAGMRRKWRPIAELVISLAEAIQYAHGRGILHRDLKPANVLFDSADRPYVADFGLAKWANTDGGLTQSTHFLLGSPAYMAPEAASGGARATTTASDIYGLGTILYELLTGHRPYDRGTAAQILASIVAEPPAPPRQRAAEIPRDLAVITEKAMARDPARRYSSAAALADDLRRWLAHLPIQARPVGAAERLMIWARRNPALAALSLLLCGSLVTGGVLLWRANQRLADSLDDAVARVDFMTRKLPERLAPLGRLDLLDDVFQNVAEHYERANARTSPAGLAREADFLTNWAQILRPRGQTLAAVEKLRSAMEKARAATAATGAPPDAIRARIRTGRRLAEGLIEAGEYTEADALLRDSTAFALAHPLTDEGYHSLLADLEMERYFLLTKQSRTAEALACAEKSLQLREPFQQGWEQPPITPEKLAGLRGILLGWDAVIAAHATLKNDAAMEQRVAGLDSLLDRLLLLAPDDPEIRFFSVKRWLSLADRSRWRIPGQEDAQAALPHFTQAEREMSLLMQRDPSNVDWRLHAAAISGQMENLIWKLGDEPGRLAARKRMVEWLEYLYSAGLTDVHFLRHIRELAVDCGYKHEGDDWPAARHHFTEGIKAQRQIVKLTGDKDEIARLEKAVGQIAEKIAEHEGPEAAGKWRAEFAPGK